MIFCNIRFKRGTAMPRSKSEVVGKTFLREMVIAAHAISVRTTMHTLLKVLNFLRSRLRDEHNASYFSKCRDETTLSQSQSYNIFSICQYACENKFNLAMNQTNLWKYVLEPITYPFPQSIFLTYN